MQQIAVRRMQLNGVKAQANARRALSTKASRTRARPASSSAWGGGSEALWAMADGAQPCQPPALGGTSWPPFHGASLEALRPAWPSWMPSLIGE